MSKKSVKPDYKKPETITISADNDSVSCDGGGGALGHPLVYYTLKGLSSVECGYCDRVFVKKPAK